MGSGCPCSLGLGFELQKRLLLMSLWRLVCQWESISASGWSVES